MKNIILFLLVILALAGCKKDDSSDPQSPTSNNFKITYSGNGNTGGTAPEDQETYTTGSTATVLSNSGNLTKTGFYFNGWNTTSGGTGTTYLPGSPITINSSNITLYANWEAIGPGTVFKITYNGNGNTSGSVPIDNTQYTPGSIAPVKANTGGLAKAGSAFVSWNTSSAGTGQTYLPSQQIVMNGNQTLYAIYASTPPPPTSGGKYLGFNASGQVKRKSTLTSSWITEDTDHTFGSSNVVSVVWNGSQYVGFNASGQVKRKNSLTSSWITEDTDHTFGSSNIVSVVWNGSQYVGFNASGQVKRKNSLTSSWITEDTDHTFGSSNVVSVTWNGSQYVGFNASGQVKRKNSLTSSWITEDTDHTFGSSNVVSVVWNGSQYVGFNASGQVKRKNSLTSSWITEDTDHTFGSSLLVTAVYH